MYESDSQRTYRSRTRDGHETWTAGGAAAYLLAVVGLVVVMAAPSVALGAVLGVTGVVLASRLARRLRRRRRGGLSPPETRSGRPA